MNEKDDDDDDVTNTSKNKKGTTTSATTTPSTKKITKKKTRTAAIRKEKELLVVKKKKQQLLKKKLKLIKRKVINSTKKRKKTRTKSNQDEDDEESDHGSSDTSSEEDEYLIKKPPRKKPINKKSPDTSKQWDAAYDELYQYYVKHGHCNVPSREDIDDTDNNNNNNQQRHRSKLYFWNSRMRIEYQKKIAGKPYAKVLTDERIEKLRNIGFRFDTTTNSPSTATATATATATTPIIIKKKKPDTSAGWNAVYEELCRFQAQHGHCNIPAGVVRANKRKDTTSGEGGGGPHPKRNHLYFWTHRMRKEYQKKMNGIPYANVLTNERIHKLNAIGFNFTSTKLCVEKLNITFDMYYQQLIRFCKDYKNKMNLLTSKKFIEQNNQYKKLSYWILKIRKEYSKQIQQQKQQQQHNNNNSNNNSDDKEVENNNSNGDNNNNNEESNMTSSSTNFLTEERINKLRAIGFSFTAASNNTNSENNNNSNSIAISNSSNKKTNKKRSRRRDDDHNTDDEEEMNKNDNETSMDDSSSGDNKRRRRWRLKPSDLDDDWQDNWKLMTSILLEHKQKYGSVTEIIEKRKKKKNNNKNKDKDADDDNDDDDDMDSSLECLHRWVKTVRYNVEEYEANPCNCPYFKKDPSKIDCLREIGIIPETHENDTDTTIDDADWDVRFAELVKYVQENGDCTSLDYDEHKSDLREWVCRVRDHYDFMMDNNKSMLTPKRVAELVALGFRFKKITLYTFNERVEQLIAYKGTHDGNDPKPDTADANDDDGLGKWCSRMRRKYQQLFHEGKGSITQEQIDTLTEIGFQWDDEIQLASTNTNKKTVSSPKSWEESFADLLQYKVQHGHTRVPYTDPILGLFVQEQRKGYKRLLAGQPSSLTTEKIKQLSDIGFHFILLNNSSSDNKGDSCAIDERKKPSSSPRRRVRHAWDTHFANLREFKQQHGHTRVPSYGPLGHWVQRMRKAYKQHLLGRPTCLTTKKIAKLIEIEFDFSIKERCISTISNKNRSDDDNNNQVSTSSASLDRQHDDDDENNKDLESDSTEDASDNDRDDNNNDDDYEST